MAIRYSSKVINGKLNIRDDYIQTEFGDFQKLTKNWIIKAYKKAKELNDTESMKKLENLEINDWILDDNNHEGKRKNWRLKDEL
jgi:hypothetical protein